MSSKKEKDYIEELKEWQDNQYNPGHYTGGKLPHFMFKPGNKKVLGLLFLLPSLLILVTILLMILRSVFWGEYSSIDASLIPTVVIAILFIVAGIRKLRNKK